MIKIPEVDELIRLVDRSADAAAERLHVAVKLSASLTATGEDLVGHYVTAAKEEGLSWAEIGTCLGVTKQAAQQRFVAPPEQASFALADIKKVGGYQRFTPRARNALRYSVDAAKELGHGFIGTEHLLLGLLTLGEGIGPEILRSVRPLPDWRALVEAVVPAPAERHRGRRPFTPLARQAVARTLEVAVRMGHNYIGTEHQLIALLEIEDGLAAKVLTEGGLTADMAIQQAVAALAKIVQQRRQGG